MKRLANSKNCFVCGIENRLGLHLVLESDQPGHVTGDVVIPKEYAGWPNVVHGGILAALLDEAGGRSADSEIIPTKVMVTGSLNIRYRKPTPVETPLIVDGQFLEQNGRVIKTKSKIMNSEREILAEADIIYVEIDQKDRIDDYSDFDQWVVVKGGEE